MFVKDLPVPHEDGSWVSERVSRIIELIRDYDPKLDVRWIPPAARAPGDAAFAIIEQTPTGPVTAFLVMTEEEFNEHVLARIYAADAARHGASGLQASHEAFLKAERDIKEKEWREEMAMAAEEAAFFLKTPLHRVQLSKNRHINL